MPTPVKSLRSVCWKSKDNVESLAVLSDRICRAKAIDDGSSEQDVGWMDGWGNNIGRSLANKVYCERR